MEVLARTARVHTRVPLEMWRVLVLYAQAVQKQGRAHQGAPLDPKTMLE